MNIYVENVLSKCNYIIYVCTVGDIKNLTFRSVKTPYYECRSMRTTIVTYAYCVRSERSLCVAGL